jgi:hypothetical protein
MVGIVAVAVELWIRSVCALCWSNRFGWVSVRVAEKYRWNVVRHGTAWP